MKKFYRQPKIEFGVYDVQDAIFMSGVTNTDLVDVDDVFGGD